MAVTQYIGARYVPVFADPVDWDDTRTYEPLTIVLHGGNSFTSKQYVPKGIAIDNEDFWALTSNYNAQIELYRKETADAVNTSKDAKDTAQDAKDTAQDAVDLVEKEVTRATTAEKTIADDLTAEVSRAKAAEKVNADEINEVQHKVPYELSNNYTFNDYESDLFFTENGTYLSRGLYGQYENATGLSVISNATGAAPRPEVLGGSTAEIAASYADRDTVSIYSSNSIDTKNKYLMRFESAQVSYTSNSATISGAPDFSKVKIGMYIDAYDTLTVNDKWWLGKIVAIDNDANTLTVDGWWQQRNDGTQVEGVPNNVGLSINLQLKAWVANFNIFTNDSPCTGIELGVFNTGNGNSGDGVDVICGWGGGDNAYRARGNFNVGFDAIGLKNTAVAFRTERTSLMQNGSINRPSLNYRIVNEDVTLDEENFMVVVNGGTTITLPTNINVGYGEIFLIFNNTPNAITVVTNNSGGLATTEAYKLSFYCYVGGGYMKFM